MALIENAKGRKDGGYVRLLGDKELGLLISRVHSAVISAGTELEKIIKKLFFKDLKKNSIRRSHDRTGILRTIGVRL